MRSHADALTDSEPHGRTHARADSIALASTDTEPDGCSHAKSDCCSVTEPHGCADAEPHCGSNGEPHAQPDARGAPLLARSGLQGRQLLQRHQDARRVPSVSRGALHSLCERVRRRGQQHCEVV